MGALLKGARSLSQVTKAPVKAGTKRKTASKAGSRGSRKVKVVSDTEDASDSTPSKDKREVCVRVRVHVHVWYIDSDDLSVCQLVNLLCWPWE